MFGGRYQVFSSEKAQVGVKSRVIGVKIQVKYKIHWWSLSFIKFVTEYWLESQPLVALVLINRIEALGRYDTVCSLDEVDSSSLWRATKDEI